MTYGSACHSYPYYRNLEVYNFSCW